MIVRDKSSWLRMVFALRGSSLGDTWLRLVIVTLWAVFVTWAPTALNIKHYSLTTTPFSLIGFALAIFFGFRNNESYDRFWEGRTLWGSLVNVSRSFTRQTLTMVVPVSDAEHEAVDATRRRLVRSVIAYVHAFRHHLRDSDPQAELAQYLGDDDTSVVLQHKNVPLAVLQRIGEQIHEAWRAGSIHDFHVPVLESSLTTMTSIQGGCERIKTTPIPFTYNVLIHRIVAVYCFALPFGLLDSTGPLTPVVVFLISYAFLGLDAIGDEIENPFDLHDNDLPLHAISRTIEINLLQLLGERDVPEPIAPVNDVLN